MDRLSSAPLRATQEPGPTNSQHPPSRADASACRCKWQGASSSSSVRWPSRRSAARAPRDDASHARSRTQRIGWMDARRPTPQRGQWCAFWCEGALRLAPEGVPGLWMCALPASAHAAASVARPPRLVDCVLQRADGRAWLLQRTRGASRGRGAHASCRRNAPVGPTGREYVAAAAHGCLGRGRR
eukprot:scaffold1085_cov407-Prasinococcus_capsulatus_cf.AAC.37